MTATRISGSRQQCPWRCNSFILRRPPCRSARRGQGQPAHPVTRLSCHVASCHPTPSRIALCRSGCLVSGLAGVRPRDLAAGFAYRPPDHSRVGTRPTSTATSCPPSPRSRGQCRWPRSRPGYDRPGPIAVRPAESRRGGRLRRRTDKGGHGVAASWRCGYDRNERGRPLRPSPRLPRRRPGRPVGRLRHGPVALPHAVPRVPRSIS